MSVCAGDGERGGGPVVPVRASAAHAAGRAVPAGETAGAASWPALLQAWVSMMDLWTRILRRHKR